MEDSYWSWKLEKKKTVYITDHRPHLRHTHKKKKKYSILLCDFSHGWLYQFWISIIVWFARFSLFLCNFSSVLALLSSSCDSASLHVKFFFYPGHRGWQKNLAFVILQTSLCIIACDYHVTSFPTQVRHIKNLLGSTTVIHSCYTPQHLIFCCLALSP